MARENKRKRPVDVMMDILLVIFILIFLGSAGYLGYYFFNIKKSENGFETLKMKINGDVAVSGTSNATPDAPMEPLEYVDINGVKVQAKFADLYTQNNDFIGWLTIEDTKIDYPVMFTPNDEEYYIHRDFQGAYSSSGTLFLGKLSDPITPSDNVVIYGHNMKAGTMFHSLLSYEKEDFYKDHKYIEFDTINDNCTYEVIAAFRTVIDESSPTNFDYYNFSNALDKDEFDTFVSTCKSRTPYDIPVTAEYGDKLITLSTCAYHADEGRYVVIAKRVYSYNEAYEKSNH